MFVVPLVAFVFFVSVFSTVWAAEENDEGKAVTEEGIEQAVDFKKLKSPVLYTKKSLSRGKMIFIRMCAECHGRDGKALLDVIADATDLTAPDRWYSGISEGEIFRSIRDGAGVSMPPYSFQIKREEDMWHLVNYVRSLWPKSMRPQLQEENKVQTTTTTSQEPSQSGGTHHEQKGEGQQNAE